MNISANFARLLQREAAPYVPFRSAYHRFASLMVLKAPDTPSVLFEAGYLTNPEDAARLADARTRAAVADALARAILTHLLARPARR